VDVSIVGDWAVLTAVVALTARAYGAEGTFPLNVRQSLHRVNGRWLYSKRA
jgi:predicted SpoU family rRNA methylase